MKRSGLEPQLTRWSRRKVCAVTGGTIVSLAIADPALAVGRALHATPDAGDGPAFPAEDQLAFSEIVDVALGSTATPGAVVGVWYPGRGTWLRAAGIGDVTTAVPVTPDDHVRIASNTKTFVATVILQLVDEGAIALTDVLEDYITGIPNGTGITIRQLLNMSAGIYDFVHDPRISETFNDDPLLAFTPDDVLAIVRASSPDFAPGERAQYCNSNYVLLGLIAENLGGQPIELLVRERILEPLGMTQTSFPTTSEMPDPFAHGYFIGEPGEALRDVTLSNPGVAWASGAMISTLADLGVWARALAEGSLISPEAQRERLQLLPLQTAPVEVGYGLGIISFGGLLGHNGGILGYSSWIVHDPDSGASIVVVTNRGGNDRGTSDAIFTKLVSYLFPDRFAALAAATWPD